MTTILLITRIETDLTDLKAALAAKDAELAAAVTERDAALARLDRLNASIDTAQGQTRRWRIDLPNHSNDATQQIVEPESWNNVGMSPVDFIKSLGYDNAEADPAMGSFSVVVWSATEPPPILFKISTYDSANLAWGDAQEVPVPWSLA